MKEQGEQKRSELESTKPSTAAERIEKSGLPKAISVDSRRAAGIMGKELSIILERKGLITTIYAPNDDRKTLGEITINLVDVGFGDKEGHVLVEAEGVQRWVHISVYNKRTNSSLAIRPTNDVGDVGFAQGRSH